MLGFFESKRLEKRHMPRYAVRLHVEIENEEGTSRNISGSGLLFETQRQFLVGTFVQLFLKLSDSADGIKCQGEIVRVINEANNYLVAVSFVSPTALPLAS